MSTYKLVYLKNGVSWTKSTGVTDFYGDAQNGNSKGSLVPWFDTAANYMSMIFADSPRPGGSQSTYTYNFWKANPGEDPPYWSIHDSADLIHTNGSGAGIVTHRGKLWAFFGDVLDRPGDAPMHLVKFQYLDRKQNDNAIHSWGSGSVDKSSHGQPCAVSYDDQLFVFIGSTTEPITYYLALNGDDDASLVDNWEYAKIPWPTSKNPVSACVFREHIYVAYEGADSSGWLSSYRAGNWSRPVKFADGVSGSPSIAAFRGLLHLIYHNKDHMLLHRSFNGNYYSPEIRVVEDLGEYASVAVCPWLDAIMVLYMERANPPVRFAPIALLPSAVQTHQSTRTTNGEA